jgi:hypothetical protein
VFSVFKLFCIWWDGTLFSRKSCSSTYEQGPISNLNVGAMRQQETNAQMLRDQLFTFTSHYFTSHAVWIEEKTYDVTEIKCKEIHMYSCVTAENMITSCSGI